MKVDKQVLLLRGYYWLAGVVGLLLAFFVAAFTAAPGRTFGLNRGEYMLPAFSGTFLVVMVVAVLFRPLLVRAVRARLGSAADSWLLPPSESDDELQAKAIVGVFLFVIGIVFGVLSDDYWNPDEIKDAGMGLYHLVGGRWGMTALFVGGGLALAIPSYLRLRARRP